MKETPETYVVDIIDERDTPFCKGYQVVVEKDNGKVAFNSIGWCKRRGIEKNALFLEENLARLKNFLQ
ncbi:hypothetical protein [Mesobacillus boroniphilus]|uniref:hypothetical protein n=1 Tax=Mesobacillus boroniphilus TaxID=308892 RepID=UPI00201B7B63|nr:hypothetical protein [Mesobacillus boroniphilus]